MIRPKREPAEKFTAKIPPAILVMTKFDFDRAMYFVEQVPTECQWYSCIERIPGQRPDQYIYKISDMFIPAQEVSDKTVESTPIEIMNMWKTLQTTRQLTDPELGALMMKAQFWAHSHVWMPPVPSKEDDEEWAKRKALALGSKAITGMIIFNKKEEYRNRIYDPLVGIEFENLQLCVEDTTSYQDVLDAIPLLHKKEAPKSTTVTYQSPATSSVTPSKHSFTSAGLTVVWDEVEKKI